MVRKRLGWTFLAGIVTLSAGCTMCPQPTEDYAYGAYGGLVQRADMLHGRVGSAFAPAEGVAGPTDHGLAPQDAPVILEPESAPLPLEASGPMAANSQSQAATAAFDPGDIFAADSN